MDKELIDHIKTQLKEHKEPYVDGAWEKFNASDRKRRSFAYWPLWTAAAVILVCLGLLLTLNPGDKKIVIATSKPKTDASSSKENSIDVQQNNSSNISKENWRSTSQPTVDTRAALKPNNSSIIALPPTSSQISSFQNLLESKNSSTSSNKPAEEQTVGVASQNLKEKESAPKNQLTFEELLAHDCKTKTIKADKNNSKNSKWESGIYVAPAMGNDSKINLNYGFALSYAVANKLSISSGVSYTSLSSSETLGNSSAQTLSGKTLDAVNAKVSGISVPLELRYKVSNRIYTNVGISALAVLNNSQNNTYLNNSVQTQYSPPSTNPSEIRTYIVQEKTVEPQSTSNAVSDNYIGFYNFSLGYTQKISEKNNISVEPFLQLPMKTFSKENLNLTNGGIRVKFDF